MMFHVDAPAFSPTRCFKCHGNRDELGFIDTTVDEEAVLGYGDDGVAVPGEPTFGRIYLCVPCLMQGVSAIPPDRLNAALERLGDRPQKLGWLSPGQAAEARAEAAFLRVELDTLVNDEAKRTLAVARRITEMADAEPAEVEA